MKKVFHFIEYKGGHKNEWFDYATVEEVKATCKVKQEINGYIPGLGGDRNYSIIAWESKPYAM